VVSDNLGRKVTLSGDFSDNAFIGKVGNGTAHIRMGGSRDGLVRTLSEKHHAFLRRFPQTVYDPLLRRFLVTG